MNNAIRNKKDMFDVSLAIYAVVRLKENKGLIVGVFSSEELAENAVKNHGLTMGSTYEVFRFVRDNFY